jgi:hypothetical protein
MTKLCKDCKYCEPTITKFLWITSVNYSVAKCKNKQAINLIDGSGGNYCEIERRDGFETRCGRDGIFWEPK